MPVFYLKVKGDKYTLALHREESGVSLSKEQIKVKIPRAEAGWWLGKEESGVVVNNRAVIWEVEGVGGGWWPQFLNIVNRLA